MKLSLYKELLVVNPKLAMLIDLSERHPKGPEALLRGHHYQRRADTGYYDRHETELDGNALLANKKTRHILKTCEVDGYGFCAESYGYPVMELQKFYDSIRRMSDHYDFRTAVEDALTLRRSEGLSEAERAVEEEFLGWRKQATRTRRSNRLYKRMRRLRRWIEENVTTAYYRFELGYYQSGTVYVHADSVAAAETQFNLFLKPAFEEISKAQGRERESYYNARYDSPAIEGPIGLMTKNERWVHKAAENILDCELKIEKLQKQILAYKAAQQMLNQYTVNMTCSYEYENKDDA